MKFCGEGIDCEFTHDIIPRMCNFESTKDECGDLHICCDKHHKDISKCPLKAYKGLLQYLELEESLGRPAQYTAYCINISAARKKVGRIRRSLLEYWRHGGIVNVLSGGYTDKMVEFEELERKKNDQGLYKGILETKNSILKMNVEFHELQTRLNNHICDLTKETVNNLLHFEATIIFNEAKMIMDMGMRSCNEGFLPLSVPSQKLEVICKDIMGGKCCMCKFI